MNFSWFVCRKSMVSDLTVPDLCRFNVLVSMSMWRYIHIIEKRVPASILLESPWFENHGIHEVSDAVAIMHRYFQETSNDNDNRE